MQGKAFLNAAFCLLVFLIIFLIGWYYLSSPPQSTRPDSSSLSPQPKSLNLYIRLLDGDGNIIYGRSIVLDDKQNREYRIFLEGDEKIKQIIIQNSMVSDKSPPLF